MNGRDDDRQRAALGLAALRLALLPVIVVGEQLVDRSQLQPGFYALLAAVGLYSLLLLSVTALHRRPCWLERLEPFIDVGLLAALDFLSGGPYSQVRKAFFVVPLGAALRQRPRTTAIWSVLAVLAYVGVSLPHPDRRETGGVDLIVTHALYLAWTGAAAVALSALLARRQDRVTRLATGRQQLVADALEAEERERRRLAYGLHDGPVQNLLTANLELKRAERGDADSVPRARHAVAQTVSELRDAIFELYPYDLEHAGLRTTLEQLAARQASHTTAKIVVHVDPEALGVHDHLVFSLARELLTNAIRHAHARRIELTVERPHDTLLLELRDDGVGFATGRPATALRDGHVGLASSRERVEALNGQLLIHSHPGLGTTIRAELPATTCLPPLRCRLGSRSALRITAPMGQPPMP